MNKRYLTGLLLLLVALDTGLTYWQNYQLPLDGDLATTVFPSTWYSTVLHDPFGWSVLTQNAVYAGTNRFFAHATMGLYWKQVPRLLQHFTNPINSLYVASALFTTATQVLLALLLAAYARRGAGLQNRGWSFWPAVALLVPLFQIEGFGEQLGITNHAITYTFFYAFPAVLLLVLLWPFYRAAHAQQPLKVKSWQAVLLVLLMVLISFNGPMGTAAAAVFLLGVGLYWLWCQARAAGSGRGLFANGGWLSGQAILLLAMLGVLSLYSLYLGRNNAENSHDHTLGELYKLLPTGVWQQLKLQWGLPLLLLALVVNAQLLRHLVPPSREQQWVLSSMRWVGAFAVVFVLLLPFGGYRPYRPFVVRGDAILPVLLGLFYAYAVSTYFLLAQLRGFLRGGYVGAVLLFTATFVYADWVPKVPDNNDCERWSLDQISRSPEPVVRISPNCHVLSWVDMHDYHDTEWQAAMLHYWGVTPVKRYYCQ